ncbi:hypothetical protein C0995_003084 [Termitomyces sp. Mi166|nr:hypothetical protein C0995_003084 [Termitomyces sp. Mi166\
MFALHPQPVAFTQRIALFLALKLCTWYSSPQLLAPARPELPPATPPPTRTLPLQPTPTTSLEHARPFLSLHLFLGPLELTTAIIFAVVATGIVIGVTLHFCKLAFCRFFTTPEGVLTERGLLLGPSENDPIPDEPQISTLSDVQDVSTESGLFLGPSGDPTPNEPQTTAFHHDTVPPRTPHPDLTSPADIRTIISEPTSHLDAESTATSEFVTVDSQNAAPESAMPSTDDASSQVITTGLQLEFNVIETSNTLDARPLTNLEIATYNVPDNGADLTQPTIATNELTAEQPIIILSESEGSVPGTISPNIQDNESGPGNGFSTRPTTSEGITLADIVGYPVTSPAAPTNTDESIQSESPSNTDEALIDQPDVATVALDDDPPIPELPPLVRVAPASATSTAPSFPFDDPNYNPLADRRIPSLYCGLVLEHLALQYEVWLEKEWFKMNSEQWDQEAADYQAKIRRLEIELATIRRDNDGLRREVAPPDYNRAIAEGAFDEWSAAFVSGAAAFVPPRRSDYTQDQPGSIPSRPTDQTQSTNTTEGTIDATVVTNPAPSAPTQSLDELHSNEGRSRRPGSPGPPPDLSLGYSTIIIFAAVAAGIAIGARLVTPAQDVSTGRRLLSGHPGGDATPDEPQETPVLHVSPADSNADLTNLDEALLDQPDVPTAALDDDPPIPELPLLVLVVPAPRTSTAPEFPFDDPSYNPLVDRRIPSLYCGLVLEHLALQYEVWLEKEVVQNEFRDVGSGNSQMPKKKSVELEAELAMIRGDNDGLRREVALPDYNQAIEEGASDRWSAAIVSGHSHVCATPTF